MISKYYKNRISMDTLLSAPMGFVHYLYYTAVQESKTDAGKAEQQAQALEDAFDEGGGLLNDSRRVQKTTKSRRR